MPPIAKGSAIDPLNAEFRRLAVTRDLFAGRAEPAPTAVAERARAERWIERFGTAPAQDGAPAIQRGNGGIEICAPARSEAAFRLFYIHGGGLVYYTAETFAPLLHTWSQACRAEVFAFDYLKSPEHSVEHVVSRLADQLVARFTPPDPKPIVLAGDSVGGLLALYFALRVVPTRIAALSLIYPVLDLRTERDSYRRFGEGYFLDTAAMRRFKSVLAPYFEARDFDPFALGVHDAARLPPCSLATAGCDVLCDEGLAWQRQMTSLGTPVHHLHFPDLPHDFCLYQGRLACARQAVARIAADIIQP